MSTQTKQFAFLLILLSICLQSCQSQDSIRILNIQSSFAPEVYSSPGQCNEDQDFCPPYIYITVYGSNQGGTVLNIEATLLDQEVSNNQVLFESYNGDSTQCIVNAVAGNILTCTTLAPVNALDYTQYIISIISGDKQTSQNNGQVIFYFQYAYTPQIYYVAPKAAPPGSQVLWNTLPLTNTTGNDLNLKIGSYLCPPPNNAFITYATDPSQNHGEGESPVNNQSNSDGQTYSWIQCQTALDQEGGSYLISGQFPAGNAQVQDSAATFFSGSNTGFYNFLVLPQIDSLSQYVGGDEGRLLNIQGIGFSDNKDKVNVKAGGLNCQVTLSTKTSIDCRLEEGLTVQTLVSGSGLKYERYNLRLDDSTNVKDTFLGTPEISNLIYEAESTGIGLPEFAPQDSSNQYFNDYFEFYNTLQTSFFNQCPNLFECLEQGTYYDANTESCQPCQAEGCVTCKQNITQCDYCQQYHTQIFSPNNETFTCEKCPDGCGYCYQSEGQILCEGGCLEGYYQSQVQQQTQCLICPNSTKCLSCTGQFPDDGQCKQCQPNHLANQTQNGLFCVPCDESCNGCNQTVKNCINCAKGYYKVQNSCQTCDGVVPVPKECEQQDDGIDNQVDDITEIRFADEGSDSSFPDYVEVWKGFFLPPRNGTYQFYSSAGGSVSVYLSAFDPNDPDPFNLELVSQNAGNDFRNPFKRNKQAAYYPGSTFISEQVTLEENNLYYMEVHTVQRHELDHATVSVLIPNDVYTPKIASSIQKVQLKSDYTPMQFQFKFYNIAASQKDNSQNQLAQFQIQMEVTRTIDLSNYEENDITVKYLLSSDLIPWDVTGSQLEKYIKETFTIQITDVSDCSGYALEENYADLIFNYLDMQDLLEPLDNIFCQNIYLDSASNEILNGDNIWGAAFGNQFSCTVYDFLNLNELSDSIFNIVFDSTKFPNILGYETIEVITPQQGEPLGGNFSLLFNGYDVTDWYQSAQISSNTSTQDLKYYLQNILNQNDGEGNNEYQIKTWYEGTARTGFTHFFQFIGLEGVNTTFDCPASQPQLTGLNPTLVCESLINPSLDMYYDVIPNDMLRTYTDKPSVLVEITTDLQDLDKGKVLSVCPGNCTYEVFPQITPIVSQFSINGSVLSFLYEASLPLVESAKIIVRLGGLRCGGAQCQGNNFLFQCTCNLQSKGGVLQIEMGSHVPEVHYADLGYAKIQGNPIVFAPQVTQVINNKMPPDNTGSIYGRTIVTIKGKHFFNSLAQDTQISFGNNPVNKIISFSTTSIVVETAEQIDGAPNTLLPVVITHNSQTYSLINQQSNIGFIYSSNSTPQIQSLNRNSASPVLKYQGGLEITGVNFGDISSLKVFLEGNDAYGDFQHYDLYILEATSTFIAATLSGGKTGDYKLRVLVDPIGSSNAQDFSYNIIITGINPTSGSDKGGTLLTISGENFSDKNPLDNNVFIGLDPENNVICHVISSTETEIVCETEPHPIGGAQAVVLQGRLLEDATPKTFMFTYQSGLTLTEDGQSLTLEGGQALQINGTGFNTGSSNPLVRFYGLAGQTDNGDWNYYNDYVELPVDNGYSDTSASVTIPNNQLVGGSYLVRVYVPNIGWAGSYNVDLKFIINSVSSSAGSDYGELLTLDGNGIDPDAPLEVLMIYGSYEQNCVIISYTHTQIVLRTPVADVANLANAHTLQIIQKNTNAQCASCQYTPDNTYSISSYTPNSGNPGSVSITIQSNIPDGSVTAFLELATTKGTRVQIDTSNSPSVSSGSATLQFSNVPTGVYKLFVHVSGDGYAKINDPNQITINLQGAAITAVTTSYNGGKQLTVTGQNFQNQQKNNVIQVCGFNCPITSLAANSISCTIPKLQTTQADTFFQQNSISSQCLTGFTILSNDQIKSQNVIDGNQETFYKDLNTPCSLTVDFGLNRAAQVSEIDYFLQIDTNPYYFVGMEILGSNDNVAYTSIYTVDYTVVKGQNIWKNQGSAIQYRYYQFKQTSGFSQCKLAEICFKGKVVYVTANANLVDETCNVQLDIGGVQQTINSKVTYSQAQTPIVTDIVELSSNKNYGGMTGGFTVVISGTGFGNTVAQTQVFIDGIQCIVQTVNNTQVRCLAGEKVGFSEPSFLLTIDSRRAAVQDGVVFYYGRRWSQETETWSGEGKPIAGDTVYVPKGQVLIVDQSSPKNLFLILVEGRVVFADNTDITFDAEYILIQGGSLIIGSEQRNYQKKLTITLYGSQFSKPLPDFGNKMIGCNSCRLDIHGSAKTPSWTYLAQTANSGQNFVIVEGQVNWQAKDLIVIASSDYEHDRAEQNEVTSIVVNGTTTRINLLNKLKYRHYGETEVYGNQNFRMKAEVGVLSRNVVIQGDDDVSPRDKFGAHLLVMGTPDLTTARIENVEFRKVGVSNSPGVEVGTPAGTINVPGKYPVQINVKGDMSDSYVKGIAVHQSYARVIALIGVRFINIINNIGYGAPGHNIFLETGTEMFNRIEGNLMVATKSSWQLYQIDTLAASFYIPNPNNWIIGNNAAGSDYYGFWFDFKNEIPSAPGQCPSGFNFGQFTNNIAHSIQVYSLKIFNHIEKTYPCEGSYNQFFRVNYLFDVEKYPQNEFNQSNFYSYYDENPSMLTILDGFQCWKNQQTCIQLDGVSHVELKNLKIADFSQFGIELYDIDKSEEGVKLTNPLIVARSNNNQQETYQKSYGILLPADEGLTVQGAQFYNFPSQSVLLSDKGKGTNVRNNGGFTSFFSDIEKVNCNATIVQWHYQTNIVVDQDGSLSKNQSDNQVYFMSRFLNYQAAITEVCTYNNSYPFFDTAICKGTQLRKVTISQLEPMREFRLVSPQILVYGNEDALFFDYAPSQIYAIFATGYVYNLHWLAGLDFESLMLLPNRYVQDNDRTFILEFNNSKYRETYNVQRYIGGSWNGNVDNDTDLTHFIDANHGVNENDCDFSSWHFTQKSLFVCINGNRNKYESIYINAVTCSQNCPTFEPQPNPPFQPPFIPGGSGGSGPVEPDPEQPDRRLGCINIWSNQAEWENFDLRKSPEDEEWSSGYPQPGDDVYIWVNCSTILDVDIDVHFLIIDGNLTFSSQKVLTGEVTGFNVVANSIWVRAGYFMAGQSEANPFPGTIDIQLRGGKESDQLVIDQQTQRNKAIVVTGSLLFYAQFQESVATRLRQFATQGATLIQVEAVQWSGSQIGIAPSFSDASQFEKHTISNKQSNAILSNLTLSSALAFDHYGDILTTVNYNQIGTSYGDFDLDTRALVLNLNRPIKIHGTDEEDWGGTIFVNRWVNGFLQYGQIELFGVELENMGQYDTFQAGIDMRNILDSKRQSKLNKVSIHDCNGMCFNADSVGYLQITQSIFFNGKRLLASFVNQGNQLYQYLSLYQNYFVGAVKRQSFNVDTEVTACAQLISSFDNQAQSQNTLSFIDNHCQGSQGSGFILPHQSCELAEQRYNYNINQAGICEQAAFVFNRNNFAGGNTQGCQWAGRFGAYLSNFGVIMNPPDSRGGVVLQKAVIAECKGAINIQWGQGTNERNNLGKVVDVFVSAIARQSCNNCYQNQALYTKYCTGSYGLIMPVVSQKGGQTFQTFQSVSSFQAITTETSVDQKFWLDNVKFDFYKKTYTSPSNCANNIAIITNSQAADGLAGHYLWNTTCNNCLEDAFFKFDDPSSSWVDTTNNRQGGCGDFTCTGLENVLLVDWDGLFFYGSVISNSDMASQLDGCTLKQSWNAYQCSRQDLAILSFQSIAPDRNRRMLTPVTLEKEYDTVWSNTINAWKERQYTNSGEPKNTRQMNFQSLIELNTTVNLTYGGVNPSDSIYWLQNRVPLGEPNDYNIIKLYFFSALALEVKVNGVKVKSFREDEEIDLVAEDEKRTCGANNYFFKNNTIHFVVTNDLNCFVQVYQVNSVFVNLRVQMTKEDFFSNNKDSNFIDRVCSYLDISTDRMKIVGATNYKPSQGAPDINQFSFGRLLQSNSDNALQILFYILQERAFGEPNTQDGTYDPKVDVQQLSQKANQLKNAIESNELDLGLDAEVLGVDTQVLVGEDLGSQNLAQDEQSDDTDQTTLIIVLSVVLGTIALVIIVGLVWYFFIRKPSHKNTAKVQSDELSISVDQNNKNYRPVDNNMSQDASHIEKPALVKIIKQ